MTYIQIEEVSVSLSNKQVLNKASIQVKKDEIVGIVGPNGSGKSTLLKTIYRELIPTEGKIIINNLDINSLSTKEIAKRISVVQQRHSLSFDLSVLDLVMLGRTPHKKILESNTQEDVDIALRALQTVGLENYKDSMFSNLSGGEQQRTYIARALAQDTQSIILDEPTNHLDIKYQFEILELLRKSRKTILVTLHDLNLAAMYCDYIYILKDGLVRYEGTPKRVLTAKNIMDIYDVSSEVTVEGSIPKITYKGL